MVFIPTAISLQQKVLNFLMELQGCKVMRPGEETIASYKGMQLGLRYVPGRSYFADSYEEGDDEKRQIQFGKGTHKRVWVSEHVLMRVIDHALDNSAKKIPEARIKSVRELHKELNRMAQQFHGEVEIPVSWSVRYRQAVRSGNMDLAKELLQQSAA